MIEIKVKAIPQIQVTKNEYETTTLCIKHLSQPELKHWNLKDEYVIFGQYLPVTSTIQLKGMQE